ncbi:rhomboid family intramembrane serine protease [Acinetobacter sp. MD2]|uniref:rhomboid family intramembrane serine protease n=1 Tax=Acinetobacter sp. MD2 TaxID=2600066 RepID=UPI002D1F4CCE|nr:rhomboid family intramembrane serine protease [Acinetobacter sp. MD2]MEB3766236.1 rhomboid family intramembrane serine protease [Acinetobacter sp. MD2]
MPSLSPPSFSRPPLPLKLWWITAMLIALNSGLYLWQIATGVDSANPSPNDALAWGADYPPLTFLYAPERLLTNMFFHFGFIHLALNMWALYLFGQVAEQIYGRVYFSGIYVLCGLAGSLLSGYLSIQDSYAFLQQHNLALLPHLSAGASGAVMGLGSALTVLAFFRPLPNQPYILSKRNLLMIMGLNLVIGLTIPNINNAAHLGGVVMGVLLSLLWRLLQQRSHSIFANTIGLSIGCITVVVSYQYCQHLVIALHPLWQDILIQMQLIS